MLQVDFGIQNKKRFHFDNLYMAEPLDYEFITLYQVGDLSCQGGYEVEEHIQVCYEISYCVSGKGYFYTNGKPYLVEQGDIYINLPGEVHYGFADPIDPFRFFYIGFNFNPHLKDDTSFLHIQKALDKMEIPIKKKCMDIQGPFQKILQELRNQEEYSELLIKMHIFELLITVYRQTLSKVTPSYGFQEDNKNLKEIIYNVINYIDNNVLIIQELKEISDALGYSYSYLSHVFPKITGTTLQSYYAEKRLEKAIKMLKIGDRNVSEIAELLHYESIHSFSKAFKKIMGISPTEYKKLHRRI